MGDLDDFLSLPPAGLPFPGSSLPSSQSRVRPTLAGLQWIDAPWGKSSGLAYRINASNIIESLLVSVSDNESSTGISVANSFVLRSGVVRIASSPDGRMVAVACCDGSLHCIDCTASNMSLRWTIPNAHSHIVPEGGDATSPVSKDRSNAACASGPVLSLDFSAENYMLILVDAKNGVALYDARVMEPSNIITPQQSGSSLKDISNATWCKHDDSDKGKYLAIGRYDGSTAVFKYDVSSMSLQAVVELGCPSDESGFVCTHLNWSSDTLAVGVCRVIPPQDGEAPDEEEEDDNAEHEAILYLATMDEDFALGKATEWMENGDVIPFFSVPKFGRHVFFTSFLRSTPHHLLAVAVNVGTDVGIIAKDDSEVEWNVIEFQEGFGASLPTDDDDEFTYPIGISVIQLPSSSFRVLLASTDGTLSTFEFTHVNDPNYFAAPLLGDTAPLPNEAVGLTRSPSKLEKQPSKNSDDGSSWVVVDESGKKYSEKELPSGIAASSTVSALSGSQQQSTSGTTSGFSFGISGSSSFGLGLNKSVFGSGSAVPVFGPGSSAPAFNFPSSASTFGATSPLISGTSAPNEAGSKEASLTFASAGFGSTGVFGFGLSPSPGGFAALAERSFDGSSSMAPFNAFSKSSKEGSLASSFGSQSLFGSANSPPKSPDSPVIRLRNSADNEKGHKKQIVKEEQKPTKADNRPLQFTAEIPSTEAAEDLSGSEKTAMDVFNQFDIQKNGKIPISSFEDMLEALGEGFHGDEYDAQLALIDPAKSGIISKNAFVEWYKTLVSSNNGVDDDSLDTAEREERAEEEASAKKAFAKFSIAVDDKSCIESKAFGDLMESLGTTYCAEEHKKTVQKLEKDNHLIYEDDFLAWYVRWLFGGDEESDGDEDKPGNDVNDDKGVSSRNMESLHDLFKVEGDSWKCEVCNVRNKDCVNKCSACETPRPGFEEAGTPSSAPVAGGESSIGPEGFTFGREATGVSGSIGSSGFTFGAPISAKGSAGSIGYTFGSPSLAPEPSPSAVGFNFGSITSGGDGIKSTQERAIESPQPQSSGKDLEGRSVASSFTPSSNKAPTPFSSSSSQTASASKSKTSASSAFPPPSTKAPTPFSSVSSKTASSVTSSAQASSAFPPSSNKAPTPFSMSSKSASVPTSSASMSSAFPPSSAKAPTPFSSMSSKNASVSTSSASMSSAFPPSSNKAPTPFSSMSSKSASVPTSSASMSSAFPPSSTKAPTPFSTMSSTSASVPSSSASMSSAFPPSSTKAPTPFSSMSSKTASVPTSSATTSSAFPPCSSKAPAPFSPVFFKTSSVPTNCASTSSSFPLSSTKAATPFSFMSSTTASVPTSDIFASSAFPPSSSKVTAQLSSMPPKPTSAVVDSGSESSAFASMTVMSSKDGANSNQFSSQNKAPLATGLSPVGVHQDGPVTSSGFAVEKLVTSYDAMQLPAAQIALSSNEIQSDKTTSKGGKEPKSDIQWQFDALCGGFERTLAELSGMSMNALRDSEDLRNQIESLVTMTQQERAKLLDIADSSKNRRDDGAFLLSRKTDLSRHVDDSQKLVEVVQSTDRGFSVVDMQPLDMESEMKRRKFAAVIWRVTQQLQLAQRRLTTLEAAGNNQSNGHLYLLGEIANLYKCAQVFEANRVMPIFNKVSLASKSVPRWQERSSGQSTYSLEDSTVKQKNRTRNFLVESGRTVGHRNIDSPETRILRWRATERSIQTLDFRTNKFNRSFDYAQSAADSVKETSPLHRKKARSLFLSPTPSRVPEHSSEVSVCLFSPPSLIKARGGWDRPSTIERERIQQTLSINAPTELQQTTLSDASRQMLSSFGSTPEKLKYAVAMKRKDTGSTTTSPKSSHAKDNGPAISFHQSSSHQLLRENKTLPSSKTTAPPPQSQGAPKPFHSQPSSTKSDSSIRADTAVAANPLQNSIGFDTMRGFGEALLDAEKSVTEDKDETKKSRSSGVSTNAQFAAPQNQTRDYKAILTTMLKKCYPARLGDVDALLRKYEGSEEALIAKVAKKYNIANPLSGIGPTEGSKPPASPGFEMSGTATASSPSPFSATAAPSPFGNSGFSNTASGQKNGPSFADNQNAGASQSQTTFGSTASFSAAALPGPSHMAPFPFAAASPNNSPFGSHTGGLSSATPFGTQVSAPFGSTAAVPMQSGAQQLFNGKSARELLIQFYQEINPSKLPKVDEVLQKYKGKEEEMFRKIANQYKVDPSKFGLSSKPTTASFGSPEATPAFGQSSTIGGGPFPFTQGGSGFGQPSALGSAAHTSVIAGNPPGGHTFGAGTNTGFGASSFGSLAQMSSSTFGRPSPGFGGGGTGGFGSPAPAYGTQFGAARR